MTEQEWVKYNLESFLILSPATRKACIDLVREKMPEETREWIVSRIKENPGFWIGIEHMGLGMAVRNLLRNIIRDENLPVFDEKCPCNWDNHYIGILEVAVKEGIYHLLDDKDKI